LEIKAPFTTEKYINAFNDAIKAGYDVLIVDSISHAWNGEGGILDRKNQLDARGGNSFTNWGKFTPEQEKFVAALSLSDIHLIATMRSKQEYVLSDNGKGKQAPQKVGMAPVQREGMEYEMSVVFDVAMNHEAAVSKDRTGLFVDKIFKITPETGETIKTWLEAGVDERVNILKAIRDELKNKPTDYIQIVEKYISDTALTVEKLNESLKRVREFTSNK
jgi:hypothetical protein